MTCCVTSIESLKASGGVFCHSMALFIGYADPVQFLDTLFVGRLTVQTLFFSSRILQAPTRDTWKIIV